MKAIRVKKDNTLALQCYDHLHDDIINGKLAPGQKLKIDLLKEQFGIGQSPIREALSRLASSGLVHVLTNKGFCVSEISESDIRDTYRTFFQIESLALKQAIKLGDDAWESNIVGALHRLSLIESKQEPVSYAAWIERNYAFHVALIAGCNSPLLLQIRADVYNRFDRYCRIAFKLLGTELAMNYEEHKNLAAAVINRNAKEALALMEHHIFGPLEEVITVLKENNKV